MFYVLIITHSVIDVMDGAFWPRWTWYIKYFFSQSIFFIYPSALLLANDKLFRNSGLIVYGMGIALAMLIGLGVLIIEI